MCLGIEWFIAGSERNKQRDLNGISIEDAERDLDLYYSSIAPVAIETSEWLYKNWSIEKFFQLSKNSRLILIEIIEREIIKKQKDNS